MLQRKRLPVEETDGVLVAVKRVEFAEEERDTFRVQAFMREISITSEASMVPFVVDVVAKHARVSVGKHVAFVGTRYCEEGSLYDCLEEFLRIGGGNLDTRPFFPIRLTSIYVYELVTALAILHSLGIAHNDIKPHNIFVQAPDHLRLGDFGFACRYTPGQMYVHNCGTKGFCSPEKMRGLPHDLERSDVWSLGCCFYALYTGDIPYDEPHDVRVDKFNPCDNHVVEIIESMLRRNPDDRPTFAKLCETHFYASGKHEFESVFGYTIDTSVYARDCRTGFENYDTGAPAKLAVSPRAVGDSDDPMRSSPRVGLFRRLRDLAGNLSPRGKNKAKE